VVADFGIDEVRVVAGFGNGRTGVLSDFSRGLCEVFEAGEMIIPWKAAPSPDRPQLASPERDRHQAIFQKQTLTPPEALPP
jgi:hypothetical protein